MVGQKERKKHKSDLHTEKHTRATCDEHTHLVLLRSHCSTRDNTRHMQHILVLTRHMQHILPTPSCVATHVADTIITCVATHLADTIITCVATHLAYTQFATHTAAHATIHTCVATHVLQHILATHNPRHTLHYTL